ncbi:MAG: RNA polymerase sigma factor, partial [Caulobacteraceae bacterium]|nr:RNA polymerase sigma factor [Caulobacter sp.]
REVHAPAAYEGFAAEPADPDRDRSLASLDRALSDLPPRQREAVEALALRQMSLDEAADATGSTKGALKVSLHRALKSLRERFGSAE